MKHIKPILISLYTIIFIHILFSAEIYGNEENNLYIIENTDYGVIEYPDTVIEESYIPLRIFTNGEIPNRDFVSKNSRQKVYGNNNYVPKTATIDKTKKVGEIPINSGTTKSGAKVYEIPIDVFPGINNFQPAITLNYNSQRGNSVLGKGWELSGISSIKRTVKNKYYDSVSEGIRMDETDSFAIDGIRLIKTDTSDISCIQFETEFGNIKILGHLNGSNYTYFEVFYPNGEKGIFGFASNDSNKLEYPLTTMTDLYENSISYSYILSKGHYNIEKISYNGSYIEFNYFSRNDNISAYAGGSEYLESSLLKNITVKHDSFILGSYDLSFTYQSSTALLSTLTYSCGDESFNPIKFYYGEGNDSKKSFETSSTMLFEGYVTSSPSDIKSARGRFHYESGEDGILIYPNYNPYYRKVAFSDKYKGYNMFENKYTGDEKIFIYAGLDDEIAYPMQNLTTGKGFIDIVTADLDGNLEDAVIKINNYVENGKDKTEFTVFKSGFAKNLYKAYVRTYECGGIHIDDKKNASTYPKFYYTGDFDGDGKTEIMAMSIHQPFGNFGETSTCYIFDLESNKILYKGHFLTYKHLFAGTHQPDASIELNRSDRLLVMDYDGDGKTDICHIHSEGITIYTFDISENEIIPRMVNTSNVLNHIGIVDKEIFVVDLNGDSLMDLLLSPKNTIQNSNWTLFSSTGIGTFEKTNFSGPEYSIDNHCGFLIQDVNGDNMTDVIKYDDAGFSTFLANNNRLSGSANTRYETEKPILIPVNTNNSNRSTQLINIEDRAAIKYAYSADYRYETLLTGMINSLGIVEINYYGLLTETSSLNDVYNKGYDAQYPYVDILEPLSIVTLSENYLNGSIIDRNVYKYFGGIYHRQGLGFCGFSKIQKNNKHGLLEQQSFDPCNYTVLKNESGPGFEKSYSYDLSVSSNRLAKIYLSSKIEKDLLNGIISNYTYKYDSYGYPTNELIQYSDGTQIENINTYSSNPVVGNGYNLGFNTSRQTKITRDGSTYTETTKINSSKKRKPVIQTFLINGYTVSTIRYNYDNYGNVLSETIQPYKSNALQTNTYTYNNYGQKLTETNTLGLKKTYSYDSYGRLKTIKEHKGAITEYTYDSFGREKSIIYPTSNIKRIFYSWDSNNENGVYSISENIDGKPRNITYFDALNRVIRLGEVGINGILRSTDIKYDSFGNIWKESNPYIESTATDWNVYTYDVYDRQIGYNEASGKNTTYSYSNNVITINDGSNTSTKKFDVFGNLISVSDSSGTINYSYNANGQLTSINTLSGPGISIEYDNYCRKISLTDPSLGNIKYSYDSTGNLFKETDSNGNSIQYIYDSHNRLAQIIRNEFSTLYHYDALGDMDSIQNSNGTGAHYIYDYIGRITQSKEYATDGIWLKKDYTYTSGNISKICYTTHKGLLATENYYYSFGNLYEVKLDDKTSIFKIEKENSFGYPTEILTGNITRKYNYSNFGFPSKRIASSTSKIYQDFSYNFDNKSGNLISRKDNIHDLEESFEYDSLNRLVAYGNQTINYDKLGNITQKSDVGNFNYNLPSKPYAVTGINLTSDAISPLNQNVSYSSFSRPLTLEEGDNIISFDYNSYYDRVKMTQKNKGTESTNYYLGGCYKVSKTNSSQVMEYLYLGGDYYSAPAILQKNSLFVQEIDSIPPYIRLENNLSTIPSEKGIDLPVPPPISLNKHLYFVLRDYLGSITHIIYSDGSLKQELSYDAWGRMRDSSTWETYSYENEPQPMFGRGYCGHEHIRVGGFINMNARLYDPALGRFLSPDPFIQCKDWSQNLNRYTYALNNPFYYIDEDGQLFWFVVGGAALIGGAFNVWNNWNSIVSAGGWKGVWQGTKYFLVGAVAGGASAAVGLGVGSMLGVTATSLASASSSIMSSVLINSSEGAVNGFLLGSLNSLVNGDDWKTALQEGAENGAFEALAGAATSVATIGAKSIAPKKNRNYHVYYGYDTEGKVRYVGITSQDPEVRFAQHRRSKNPDGTPTDRSSLHFVVQEKLGKKTKLEARIWEQQQINLFKLKKNGGDLFNKRNEIRVDLWEKYGIKP